MATYTPNYNLEKPEASDPFGDFRESYNDNLDIIDANLGGGGGSGGHTIVDPDGNSLPQEDELQFTGAVSVTDDNVNGRTVVNVSGGSNLILDAQIYSTEEKQVGVWKDKKPLYQKTVEFTTASSHTTTYTHGIANIQEVVEYEGLLNRGDGYFVHLDFARWDGSADDLIGCQVSTSNINVFINSSFYYGKTVYVTLRYTKTTDVAGSGGFEAYGFSPVIYSDVERVIGVWRDNKPLYQKTVYYAGGVNGNVSFTHGIIDIDEIVSVEGIAKDTDVVGEFIPFARIRSDSLNIGISDVTLTSVIYYVPSQFGGRIVDIYITIRYTKTTDVAGSGDYNTYGVPTVHYSTSEQVIGTWTNGKPCYEITLEGSGSYASNTEHIIPLPLNADNVRIMSGFVDIGTDWLPISLTLGLGTSSINGVYCYPNKSDGLHLFSSAWTFTKYSIVIQYTKSTD